MVQPDRADDEKVIRAALANSGPLQIEYNDEGWDSRVYLVNGGQAVFKFPRASYAAILPYQQEIAVLNLLTAERYRGGVRLPVVRWVGPDCSWFGYAGIVGAPLTQLVGSLDASTKKRIGVEIGSFLRVLHQEDKAAAPEMGIEAEIANYTKKHQLGTSALAAAFSQDEQRQVATFILEEVPAGLRDRPPAMKFCHADLGPWNIVLAEDGGATGVIDFADAGFRDPSIDLSGFGDEVIFEAAATSYGADARLRERARLRSRALPLLDIPYYLGKGDTEGVSACIGLVRTLILEGETPGTRRFLRD